MSNGQSALQVEADPGERDAETRVAAVKALAAVAQKLFAQPAEPQQSSQHSGRIMPGHVIEPLLTAMEDYSTDNRSVQA